MSDPIRCHLYHELDGECCKDKDCLFAPMPHEVATAEKIVADMARQQRGLTGSVILTLILAIAAYSALVFYVYEGRLKEEAYRVYSR